MLSNYSPDGSLFGSGQLLDDLVTYVRRGAGLPTDSGRRYGPASARGAGAQPGARRAAYAGVRRSPRPCCSTTWYGRTASRAYCSTRRSCAACWRPTSSTFRCSTPRSTTWKRSKEARYSKRSKALTTGTAWTRRHHHALDKRPTASTRPYGATCCSPRRRSARATC